MGVFTVTCLEQKWVGRSGSFFQPKQLNCTYWLSLCFTSKKLCFYKGKRKLLLAVSCEKFVLFALYEFLFCFVNIYFFANV